MRRLFTVASVLAILVTAGCADRSSGSLGPVTTATPSASAAPTDAPTTEPTATPSPETEREMTYEVWFAYGPGPSLFVTHRTEPFTPRVGAAAVTALLDGPTADERRADVASAVPDGVDLLGLTIEEGTAFIDLSDEFESGGGSTSVLLRLAQLTYTLTQFASVDDVVLLLEGERVEVFSGEGVMTDEPMTRRRFAPWLPPILVQTPAIGERAASPIVISGTANVFEANVSISIVDANGDEIVRTFTTATCGTGCRGTFEAPVRYDVPTTQRGIVRVYEASAMDGRPTNVVEIPVVLTA